MGLWSQMKTWFILQLILGYVFITSGFIVCFLMLLTYIFIWPWNKTLYRKIVINLAYSHWSQFTFVAQWWAGAECVMACHDWESFRNVGREHVIVTMNHKYDIDWLMAWILAERFQMLGGTKIYGKSSLKLVPLIGWAWTFTESIFLKREWEKDREIIARDLSYITQYPEDYWVTLLLFCEGTRFTDEKHKASNKVAREKGLKELKHHLLPRTKGFVLSVNGVKGKIPSILDLTVGFRKDGAEPTLWNVIQGKPVKAEMYVRRIPLTEVPTDTDEACAAWLHKLYQEKDEVFDNFHKNGEFTIGTKFRVQKRINDLVMWIFWAIFLCTPLFYYLWTVLKTGSLTVQLTVLASIVVLSIMMRLMVSVTEIKKGSKYGATEIKPQEEKKME